MLNVVLILYRTYCLHRSFHVGRVCETLMSNRMVEISESEVIPTPPMNASASSSSCSQNTMVENESIEESKVHWSELSEDCSTLSGVQSVEGKFFYRLKKAFGSVLSMVGRKFVDRRIVAENRKVFKTLQSHPQWGDFFVRYEAFGSSLVVGEKFAEGAQAEIFNATLKWQDFSDIKCALKVFKKGSLLQHLQSQWPQGYLQQRGKAIGQWRAIRQWRSVANVGRGLLLPNGEFAFLMKKEDEDLRRLIVRKRVKCGRGCGPFEEVMMEYYLYDIASGMDWLHKHDVVHRDLKASNVLVTFNTCFVADYECSIGVIGTGFWRDPQILQACKEGNVSQRPELFTRAADVYSYGMTCYEILTGKIPFEDEINIEGHNVVRDLVIEGHRPMVPEYVQDWICKLLWSCWQSNRDERPTFEEILNLIATNATSSFVKSKHVFNMRLNNEEFHPILGCNNLSHSLVLLERAPYESGVYMCKLCFKQGSGVVHHCSSCGDFDLHPECAAIPAHMKSSMHSHDLVLLQGFERRRRKIICDACRLEVLEGIYYNSYKCHLKECKFDVHIHCAKYTRTILHNLHEEHELVLDHTTTIIGEGKSSLVCNHCNLQLSPFEIVYCCKECGFNIHPHCIIGKLECKPW